MVEQPWFIAIMVILAVLGGYIVTSLLLFKYPNLLHKKKNLKFRAVHISHRGGAGEHLENTMTAFRHARALGTDMLEVDCHITADGLVVISHDNTLNRTCGKEIEINEVNYQDLPMLCQTLPVDFFHRHTTECVGDDRRIPLLEEVFQEFPDLPVNIDIKVDDAELITKVSDLVRKYNREHLTAWGNRSNDIETKLYRENPNIPLIFSLPRVVTLLGLFYTGLLPFVPLRESLLEIIMPSILLDDKVFNINFTRKQKIIFSILETLLMRPALFRHLEKRGIQTYVWVLNEERAFERAFSLGVAGVMTDFPTKLRLFLDAHPEYCGKPGMEQQTLYNCT